MKRYYFLVLTVGISALFAACGTSSNTSPSASTVTITGSVVANAVGGAVVAVKKSDGTTIATSPAATTADGGYSVTVPAGTLASDLYIESSGGTYTDEATGTAGVSAGTLSGYVPAGTLSGAGSVQLTPGSTIVQKLVAAGKTFVQATADFQGAFGFQPDTSVKPDMGSTASEPSIQSAQKLAGVRVAAFSQLTKGIANDPAKQMDLLNAIALDLEDGTLDGMNGGTGSVVVNGLQLPSNIGFQALQALNTFLADTAHNTSGLTSSTAAPDTVARTATYKVTYIPGNFAAAVGKTTFQLKIENRASGVAVSGTTISLTPTMHMSTMNHTTPVDGCAESSPAGTYDCTLYYLMVGGGGSTMGDWVLRASVNGETTTFFPAVAMVNPSFASGDTSSQTLRFSSDTYTSMGTASVRPYYIFRDSVSGATGNHTFTVFIGTRETLMSHPALYSGLSMNSSAFTASSVLVEISTDASTWTAMTEDMAHHGRFSASGIRGLTSGSAGTVYIRLTINGNLYNNNSAGNGSASGAKSYGSFTVTVP